MTFIRTTSAAIAALGLMACGAMAQDKAGGAAAPAGGGAPAAGGAGAAGGALRPPEAGAPAGGAGARPASPGMAPAGASQAVPGARNAGENAGESPAQKPAAPGTAAEPGRPAGAAEGTGAAPNKNGRAEGQPGQAENGQAGKAKGAARPAPQITNVQETKIKQSFKTVDVHPVNVNFNIGVGVAVPTSVVLQPLPPTIIDVVPGYEGYRFFVVPGQIVIVDPLSLEIVAVLPL